MKERPIIMSADSVQAILDGMKTQTRRVVKRNRLINKKAKIIESQYGNKGDLLWVRETFGREIRNLGGTPHEKIVYRASNPEAIAYYDCNGKAYPVKWKPSIFMPSWASRITLEITNIRVERLQDITQEDVAKEGIISVINDKVVCSNPNDTFIEQWDKLNAKRGYSWDSNPFVWVIEFRRVEE